MEMKVGLAGLGRMGGAIARRLGDLEVPLTVFNRSREKADALAGPGIAVAASPRELAQGCDIVLAIVADDAAACSLHLADEGLLAGASSGTLLVEMSTLKPATVATLADAARAAGIGFVEAPVMGTVGPARAGRLVALAGGEEAEVARAGEVLRHITRHIVRTGPVGTACIAKLAANAVLLTYLQAVAEGLAFGVKGGLSLDVLLETLTESAVGTPVLAIKSEVLRGRSPPAAEIGASLATVRKDMVSIAAVAGEAGVPMPAAAATLASLAAACSAGWSERDVAEIATYHRLLTA